MHVSHQSPRLAKHQFLRTFMVLVSVAITLVFARQLGFPLWISRTRKFQERHISGQWKELRQDLGLPSLPDTIKVPVEATRGGMAAISARFDVKRKRYQEQPILFFSPEALEETHMTLEEIAQAFGREQGRPSGAQKKAKNGVQQVVRKPQYHNIISKD